MTRFASLAPLASLLALLVAAVPRCAQAAPFIRFGVAGSPDMVKIHARFPLTTSVDPFAEGLTFSIVNVKGDVYRATLEPGDLEKNGKRYGFKDDTAAMDGVGIRGGLSRVRVKVMMSEGAPYLVFYVTAFGDLSAATESRMETQVWVGDDVGYLDAEWTPQKNGWKLFGNAF